MLYMMGKSRNKSIIALFKVITSKKATTKLLKLLKMATSGE
jgi:hypothetical protein